MPFGPGALGLARLRRFSLCDCLGKRRSPSALGTTLSLMNCVALIGSMFFFAKTFDQLRAKASVASYELEVVELSSLIIAKCMALRSKVGP